MVALKILNQSAIKDQRDNERFYSEAIKVAKSKHPNIVDVYDYGQMESDYFISMEFIAGITLKTFIDEKKKIPILDILVIAKKIFEALAHSHKNKVIHRDIKPKNIMVNNENEIKVVDFGIAVLRDELKKENRDAICGTPLYMSPEQFKDLPIDHRTDIYSAGVTLFHLVTGEVPFDGDTFLEIMEKHLEKPVPRIKEYREDLPEKLIQIIEKCVEKKREDRYQGAAQVIAEIDGIKNSKGNVYITDQASQKIFEKKKLTTSISCEDTQILKRKSEEKYLTFLQDDDKTIGTKIKDLQDIVDIGGKTAIEALKKVLTNPDKQLAKAARDGLMKLGKLKLSYTEFIDKIDIPTFAYHLVLCRYASPELLTELNPVEVRKAIQEIHPGEKGDEDLVPALKIFEEKYSHQEPDPSWHSWITTTRGERIKEVKKMLLEMINP
jgi:serine/threonine protein kinase